MIKQGAEPVFIAGNQTGILFLHGFTASPHELRSFAELIHQKKGFTVSVPLIAGHGESNEILNNTRFNAFQNSADTGYQNLKKICNKIFLVGMSMGGSLCLDLASKYQVDGIILMGTPLFLPLKTAFLPIVLPVKKYLKKHDGPD
ncbi:MAG: alpha/beta fold hydrolase, partial [Calditrichaeota bacterium]|nr:alpha/beta fold hydrolase [Calditrichota bacterium]